jgi:hypothetical protein
VQIWLLWIGINWVVHIKLILWAKAHRSGGVLYFPDLKVVAMNRGGNQSVAMNRGGNESVAMNRGGNKSWQQIATTILS